MKFGQHLPHNIAFCGKSRHQRWPVYCHCSHRWCNSPLRPSMIAKCSAVFPATVDEEQKKCNINPIEPEPTVSVGSTYRVCLSATGLPSSSSWRTPARRPRTRTRATDTAVLPPCSPCRRSLPCDRSVVVGRANLSFTRSYRLMAARCRSPRVELHNFRQSCASCQMLTGEKRT